jgi:PAS domain S-box-containing protein
MICGMAPDDQIHNHIEKPLDLWSAIDAIPALVVCARPDGSVEFVNQAWRTFTGAPLEKLSDWGWLTVIHPEDLPKFMKEWTTARAAGETFENEARVRRADGEYRWFSIRKAPLRNAADQIVSWYGTGHDIENLKRADGGIHQDTREIRELIDAVPAHVFVMEADGTPVCANRAVLEYTGLTLEEIRSALGAGKMFHPKDLNKVRAEREINLRAGVPFETEASIRGKDGQYRWFLIRVNPLKDDHGNIVRWYSTGTDIEDLKTAENRLRAVVDTTPALIHTARPDGYIDFFNRGWLEYFGLPLENVAGWMWTKAFHPDDVDACVGKWRAALASGEPFDAVGRVRRVDGEYRTLLHRKVPLRDKQGNIVKWYGSSLDIEDMKRAEERAWKSERELQVTIDTVPAIIYTSTAQGQTDFCNRRWLEYTGLSQEDSHRWAETGVLHPDDLPRATEALNKALATGTPIGMEARFRGADGQYRWFWTSLVPLRAEKGDIVKWYGSAFDIEDRKRSEEALRRSERLLSEAQRLTRVGSWEYRADGSPVYWSPVLFEIFGIDPAKGPPDFEASFLYIHPDDREIIRQNASTNLAEGEIFDHKFRIIRSDGEIRAIREVGSPVYENGIVTRYFGACTDITEEEQKNQALRRTEAYLAEAQRLSHTGSFGWNVATGEISWSDETLRIFEYDREIKPSLDLVIQRVHPDDKGLIQRTIAEASEHGSDFESDHRLLMPDGRVKYLRVVAHSIRDASGAVEFVGALTDITGAKEAEKALRKSEQQWRDVFENNPTMYFMIDASGTVMAANPYGAEQLGYTVDELVERSVLNVFHGPDRQEAQRHLSECQENIGKTFSWEVRKIRKNGSMLWVRETARAVLRGDQPVVLVACEDITERKNAEERIREQEIELRQVLDLTPQHVGVLGPDGSRLYANRVTLEYFGVNMDRWRSDGFRFDLVYPDDHGHFVDERKKRFREGVPHEFEARLLRHDGRFRWFLFRLSPLKDKQDEITRWYSAATDIEDRKQAEERLRHENVALREELNKSSPFEEIVGTSPALQAVVSRVSKVAPTDSSVLITGETGTGKELVARAIHRRSRRSSRSFISVNCAAIPRELIASELFGHEKGAFTGATQRHLGRFELAEGGTIFLDEIGELPTESQIALLRVLQEHEFERVGGAKSITTNVRVIAATNRELQADISSGAFRKDLFYRLNVFPIHVPALRERKEDIPLLVEYFIDRFARNAGKSIREVTKKTLELLESYSWPGNIRELQNVLERSVILCDSELLSVEENWLFTETQDAEPNSAGALSEKLAAQERLLIETALRECRGRVYGPSGAAAKLGMPRSTLEYKIRSLRINKNLFKTDF